MLWMSPGEIRLFSGVGPSKEAVPSQAGTSIQCSLAGRHNCLESTVGFHEQGLPLSSSPMVPGPLGPNCSGASGSGAGPGGGEAEVCGFHSTLIRADPLGPRCSASFGCPGLLGDTGHQWEVHS